jgi:hypothetical protein
MNRYTGPWNGALNGRITGRTQEWYKGDQGITYVPSVNPGGGAVLGSGLHGSSGTFAQQQAWQGQQQTTHAPHQQWYSSWQREQAKLWQQQAGAQQPTSPETTTQVSTPTRSATPNVSRTPPSAAPPPPRSSGTMPPKPPKLTDSVLNAMRVDANLMGKIDEIEPGSDKRSKAEYPTQQREFERYVEYLKKGQLLQLLLLVECAKTKWTKRPVRIRVRLVRPTVRLRVMESAQDPLPRVSSLPMVTSSWRRLQMNGFRMTRSFSISTMCGSGGNGILVGT